MKQRTFIIQPFALLYHVKRLFGNQNEALKMFKWSCYGLNPYCGGTDLLAQRLLKHKRFWFGDAVRWDRLAAFMQVVWDLRLKYTAPDPFKEWAAKHTVSSWVVLPNGDLVYKTWGNNSGTGTTTGDNIFGMTLIIYHTVMYLMDGDENALSLVEVGDFGDDFIGSDSLPISDEQLEAGFRHVFKNLYGVDFDPFVITYDFNEVAFLGFTFTFLPFHNSWVPKYDKGILAKSFLTTIGKMKPEGEINKMFSLMLMSAGNGPEVYDLFRTAFIEVVYQLQSNETKLLRKFGVPDYFSVIDWYLGLESSNPVFQFFYLDTELFDWSF